MEGRVLSHYRVLEKLGGGAMGVVYRGLDLRLDRHVALKFLPSELSRDPDARERLTQEARAASALDHPNLCTIHDIDATPEGQLFIAMAYYDGATLKKQIANGPLTLDEALDIAIQMAQGLAEAHAAGIVHRDIKPANVMLTKNGLVKIVDFGIAKLVGATGPTRAGTTIGTVAYMSPEQVECEPLDPQSDVWSLGAVLYELLVGQPPFNGDHEWAVMNAIRTLEAKPPSLHRANLPHSVDALVGRALAKHKADRFQSASEFLEAAKACRAELRYPASSTLTTPGVSPGRSRRGMAAAGLVIVLVAAGWWFATRGNDARWARDEAVPQIQRLLEADQYSAAFVLAARAEQHIANDPRLIALWPQISRRLSFTTTPEGATVSYAPYSPDAPPSWISVGRSPLRDLRVPQGPLHVRVAAAGFDTIESLIAPPIAAAVPTIEFTMDKVGIVPDRMVRIAAGDLRIALAAFDDYPPQRAPAYLIDKYEVTNREFKAFVDAGGYRDPQYWEHAFEKEGRVVPWQDAMSEFRDQTGRPGPSTWEGGTYPQGQDDYPVSGVSWYEAAAYAKFRGRSLPTVYHWLGATATAQAAYILPLSNIGGGSGPRRVGSSLPGLRGTYDMAGNVKEWCANRLGTDRFILGGAWNEPSHLFFEHEARDPFSRQPEYGFRTVDYLAAGPQQLSPLLQPLERVPRNYAAETPASDEVFRAYLAQFAYDPMPLNASPIVAGDASEHWRKETVTFDAAYGRERISADLFIPKNVQPPYQTILFFPGAGTIQQASSKDRSLVMVDYIIKSGRVVMYPIYKDSFERRTGLTFTDPTISRSYVEHLVWWVKDVMRSMDYLESRPDIARDKVAFLGFSWGGRVGSIAMAVERRFKVGVLAAGGFPLMQSLPEVKEINFAPRITIPVLMVSGRHDRVFPLETSQKPMFRFLGSPAEHKKHVVFDAGHGLLEARSQMVGEVLAWFEKYLGPVQ
jgi:serine/threonine protein kinase/formylglycine-generating enzyme required for sulfatase activity/dienelactone hydrolase